jgi:hypothetical protein
MPDEEAYNYEPIYRGSMQGAEAEGFDAAERKYGGVGNETEGVDAAREKLEKTFDMLCAKLNEKGCEDLAAYLMRLSYKEKETLEAQFNTTGEGLEDLSYATEANQGELALLLDQVLGIQNDDVPDTLTPSEAMKEIMIFIG